MCDVGGKEQKEKGKGKRKAKRRLEGTPRAKYMPLFSFPQEQYGVRLTTFDRDKI